MSFIYMLCFMRVNVIIILIYFVSVEIEIDWGWFVVNVIVFCDMYIE